VPQNFVEYLQAHRECTGELLRRAKTMDALEVECSSKPGTIRIRRMVYEVMNEIHRTRGFVRLASQGETVLYGYLKPRHHIGFQVADFLAQRFSQTVIILGNGSESWISLYVGGQMLHHHGPSLEKTLEHLGPTIPARSAGVEDAWRAYRYSQSTGGGDNRTFHRHMPKQSLISARSGERAEGDTRLQDFFTDL